MSGRFPDFITLDSWFWLPHLYFIQTGSRICGTQIQPVIRLTAINNNYFFRFAKSKCHPCEKMYDADGAFSLQVKIWFQNRRMKWKRSKKAQQEAKSSKDGEHLNTKAQSSANSVKSNSQESANHVESPSSVRKVQEGESLYRPYVV